MARIAVFDSGLGSLSVIRALRRQGRADLVYFADTASFPYGTKSPSELCKIIEDTIGMLEERFCPDVIVMASNTPSLVLEISDPKVVQVRPPLEEAAKISSNIGILATRAAIKSKKLDDYAESVLSGTCKIVKIDGSRLVSMVEDCLFVTDKESCIGAIREDLSGYSDLDVVTLSSTHLSFLKEMLEGEFPDVKFLDPADAVARQVFGMVGDEQPERESLQIFTSGDPATFEKKLRLLDMKDRVRSL